MFAWDSDYTKVTAKEAEIIEEAENIGFVKDKEIDWDLIGID